MGGLIRLVTANRKVVTALNESITGGAENVVKLKKADAEVDAGLTELATADAEIVTGLTALVTADA